MSADPLGFDIERQRLARGMFQARLQIGILRAAIFTAAIGLFLVLGGSSALRGWVGGGNPFVVLLLYVTVLYLALWVADVPFSARGHVLEVRYGLARQGWRGWALDDLKALGFGYVFTLIAVEVVYWLLRNAPTLWGLYAWLLGLGVSILASVAVPTLFVRLFYRVSRLADPELEGRLRVLAERAGIRLLGVFVVRTSVKTARSNAALAGVGRTRRILLTDTLLESHSPDEIETILAHELAHHRHRDPALGFALFALTSLTSLAVLQAALPWATEALRLEGIADPAGLPVLMLAVGGLSLAFGPIERALSRWREARADRLALELTGKPDAFATAMVKLHDANLSLARPPRVLELLAMGHPAAWRRVKGARAFRGRALK